MTVNARWAIWGGLLVAVAALVISDHAGRISPAVVEAVAPRGTSMTASSALGAGSASALAREPTIASIRPRRSTGEVGNAFSTRDWNPPPPPPRAIAPVLPPQPSLPPFPYTVFGKQSENGAWQVFLRRDQIIVVVKAQDVIDDRYRVDAINPPHMTLTYLPLSERQTISIGDSE